MKLTTVTPHLWRILTRLFYLNDGFAALSSHSDRKSKVLVLHDCLRQEQTLAKNRTTSVMRMGWMASSANRRVLRQTSEVIF